MIRLPSILLCLLAVSCAAPHPSPNTATGDAATRIDTRAQRIATDADRLKPHTDDSGLPLLAGVKEAAGLIRHDAGEASKANAQQAVDLAAETARADKAEATLGYRLGQWVKRFAWIIGGVLGLSVVLRLVGMFATGPWGAAASFASTGIIGIFTGGLSLIQTLFDNLWFRKMAPTPAREVNINRGGAS